MHILLRVLFTYQCSCLLLVSCVRTSAQSQLKQLMNQNLIETSRDGLKQVSFLQTSSVIEPEEEDDSHDNVEQTSSSDSSSLSTPINQQQQLNNEAVAYSQDYVKTNIIDNEVKIQRSQRLLNNEKDLFYLNKDGLFLISSDNNNHQGDKRPSAAKVTVQYKDEGVISKLFNFEQLESSQISSDDELLMELVDQTVIEDLADQEIEVINEINKFDANAQVTDSQDLKLALASVPVSIEDQQQIDPPQFPIMDKNESVVLIQQSEKDVATESSDLDLDEEQTVEKSPLYTHQQQFILSQGHSKQVNQAQLNEKEIDVIKIVCVIAFVTVSVCCVCSQIMVKLSKTSRLHLNAHESKKRMEKNFILQRYVRREIEAQKKYKRQQMQQEV